MWFVLTLKFENLCSRKQSLKQGLTFCFVWECKPRRVRIKEKERWGKLQRGKRDLVLTMTWKFVYRGTAGHSAGASSLHWEFLFLQRVCKSDSHLVPSWLLFLWMEVRITGKCYFCSFWVTISESGSKEAAASQKEWRTKWKQFLRTQSLGLKIMYV